MKKEKRRGYVHIRMEAPYSTYQRIYTGQAYTRDHDRVKLLRTLLSGDPVAARLHRQSFSVLDAWSVILPIRVVNEDLGDYLEDIASRASQGQRILVWLRVATAIIWTGINAVGYVLKQIGHTKAT